MHKCAIIGCTTNKSPKVVGDQHISTFNFPKDKELAKWIAVIGANNIMGDTRNTSCRICEKHFLPEYFLSCGRKKRLPPGAVPSLNLTNEEQTRSRRFLSVEDALEVALRRKPKKTKKQEEMVEIKEEIPGENFDADDKRIAIVKVLIQLGQDKKISSVKVKSMEVNTIVTPSNLTSFPSLCLCGINYALDIEVERSEDEKPQMDVLDDQVVVKEEIPDDLAVDSSLLNEVNFEEEIPLDVQLLVEEKPQEIQLPVVEVQDPFECQICHQVLAKRVCLRNHMKTHQSYTCDYCGKTIKGQHSLLTHFSTVHGLGTKCKECDAVFANKKCFINHLACHSKEKTFHCDVCSFQTHRRQSLLRHIGDHRKPKTPAVCHLCGKVMAEKRYLKVHLNQVHKLKLENTHHRRFFGRKEEDNPTTKKKHPCKMCDKRFSHKFSLKVHMDSVHLNKTNRCTQCDKTFSSPMNLWRHINGVHTQKKFYQCEVCSKVFHYRDSYNNHIRIHYEDKQLECPFCSKKFTDNPTYYRHKKEHQVSKDIDKGRKSIQEEIEYQILDEQEMFECTE